MGKSSNQWKWLHGNWHKQVTRTKRKLRWTLDSTLCDSVNKRRERERERERACVFVFWWDSVAMGYNSNWQVSLSSFVYRKCKRKGSNLNRYTVTIKMYPVNQGTRDNSLVKVTKSEAQTWSSERQTGRFVVQRTSACVSILSFTLLSLSLSLSLSFSLPFSLVSCLFLFGCSLLFLFFPEDARL